MVRRLTALDEIYVKVNELVGFMLDADRGKIYEGLSIKKCHRVIHTELLN
jgi:hypothetical protein